MSWQSSCFGILRAMSGKVSRRPSFIFWMAAEEKRRSFIFES